LALDPQKDYTRTSLATGESDSRVLRIVAEQRDRIRTLEGYLMQAKVDYEDLLMQRHLDSATQPATASAPKELEEALRAIVDLREEYSQKLRNLQESHELSLNEQRAANESFKHKVQSQTAQLELMEKKELKLSG